MLISPSTRWRAPMLAAVFTTVALAAAGCSAAGSTGVPAQTVADTRDTLFTNAIVAKPADILPDSTMAAIKKRGKLIVAEALDAPLLSQQDPSNPDSVTGFDADLAKLLAIYIIGKPNVEIVPPASETREALLANGTVDVVFNTYTITTKRADQVDFAGPYFESGLAVAVAAGNTKIKGIDDLVGKTVIVGSNTPAVTAVPERQPSAKIVGFATDPEAVQALAQGRGDAYVQDQTLLASDALNNRAIKVVGQPFTHEAYGIGLKHRDGAFKKFINDWLVKTQQNGTWGKVWTATLGTVIESAIPTPPVIGSVPGS